MAHYSNGNGWRAEHQKTRAMMQERNKYLTIYTPVERIRVDEAIEGRIKQTRGLVEQGARQEWESKRSDYRAAEAAEQAARKREAARWQPDRLQMEYSFARSAFDRAQDVKAARAEYDRAVASGDIHKMRAFSETFSTALAKFPNDRLEAHRLAVDAQRRAEEMQITDEIVEAQGRKAKVIDELVGLQHEIGAVSQELDIFDLHRMVEQVRAVAHFDGDSGKFNYTLEEAEPAKAATIALPDQRQTYDKINHPMETRA